MCKSKYNKYLGATHFQILSLFTMIVQYKNSSIYYEDEGHGEAVVLLHGFLENTTMWSNLKPRIAETKRVICVDLLGHGQSDCIGYIHTMEAMAEAVLFVLEYLKIDSYTIIGHSMGGYVALAMAEIKPKSVKALCLMNSTYKADDTERKAIRKRANQMIQTNFDGLVRMSFTNLFSPESRKTHKDELEAGLKMALQTPVQGYIAAQKGMMIRSDKFEFYKNLKAKKLIIIGQKDPVVDGKKLLDDTKNTTIDCVELAYGHMSHIENRKEITYILLHFIE